MCNCDYCDEPLQEKDEVVLDSGTYHKKCAVDAGYTVEEMDYPSPRVGDCEESVKELDLDLYW